MLELFGLFTSALLSATLLPGGSEAVLVGLIALNSAPILMLVFIATLGNVLGSLVNWFLGLYARQWENHPRFPIKPHTLARYEAFYAKYGRWTLLACWVPFVGDPITLAAGVAKTPLIWFLTLVTLAKAARYGVVASLALQLV